MSLHLLSYHTSSLTIHTYIHTYIAPSSHHNTTPSPFPTRNPQPASISHTANDTRTDTLAELKAKFQRQNENKSRQALLEEVRARYETGVGTGGLRVEMEMDECM
jgi:hypothetical protein